jgi:general secretion pathway protein A
MSRVSDPQGKRWLADDPNFLASLTDLDRGLRDGSEVADEDDAAAVVAPPPPAPSVVHRALSDRFGDVDRDPAPPPPLAFARPPLTEPRTRRPLLDLFPAAPRDVDGAGPPLGLGTAVGPQLPPARPRARRTPEDDTPSPLDGLTYETFYGLREKPFSVAADPKFHYQSGSHERAAQDLLAAMRNRSGAAVLTAPVGMGKTTLCRALVQEIDRRTVVSLVLEPLQTLDDLLRTMLIDFGVVSRDDIAAAPRVTRDVLTRTLHSFLESLVPLQASAVLFIDETQNVPVTLLAELGVMLAAPAARVLQLVLVGQPALTAVLQRAELRTLNASVARRIELGPLGADEIAGYVMHRLSIAGAHTRIEFDAAAIARLFELSAGSPRVVNVICDRAMTRGQAASAAVIDGGLIESAAADLDLERPPSERPGALTLLLRAAAFVLLVLAGAAAALWVSRDAVGRTLLQWENVPEAPGGPIRRLPVPLAPIPPPAEIPDNVQPDAAF